MHLVQRKDIPPERGKDILNDEHKVLLIFILVPSSVTDEAKGTIICFIFVPMQLGFRRSRQSDNLGETLFLNPHVEKKFETVSNLVRLC